MRVYSLCIYEEHGQTYQVVLHVTRQIPRPRAANAVQLVEVLNIQQILPPRAVKEGFAMSTCDIVNNYKTYSLQSRSFDSSTQKGEQFSKYVYSTSLTIIVTISTGVNLKALNNNKIYKYYSLSNVYIIYNMRNSICKQTRYAVTFKMCLHANMTLTFLYCLIIFDGIKLNKYRIITEHSDEQNVYRIVLRLSTNYQYLSIVV